MTLLEIHQFLERLGNLIRSQTRRSGGEYGLQPVHLNALYYFSVCNKYSDTLLALADYLGQTRGTTSQTLKLLEERGLISRRPDANDGRVVHLKLTAAGRKMVRHFWPTPVLSAAESALAPQQWLAIRDQLKLLLLACQQSNGHKTFAVCRTCRHHEKRGRSGFCALTQEPLTEDDAGRICREHEFPLTA
ncbi:MAG: MarR family transcriptional regulator [Nitrospinaceae bacterium]|nr:winged helix-turn-helix transcriptional regulator [Nitrospinaceae bacterium]NIR54879.1 winged helix-turn-helix transcriptional regulator [Nitrospinaceae bacterium]NIS85308.1 winged helix-turn-helix transcriptional regulator [Nitrospinaceae bacterium]NIT82117.1 winged helix-turn-helix transcriptional regulator [Nitrospinaceae bacterium]NIU44378.1 winged helix-turn-helix transcriptional regulator [Nitrospinaceae bacterium]